jgi:Leucine-rich repeat (LRR) protein
MELRYLRLSNNLFYGNIPFTITNLGKLYDLDLAGNGLSGAIPCHLSNLTAMAGNGKNDDSGDQGGYFDGSLSLLSLSHFKVPVTTKGQELYYYFALSSMVTIDLSSNYLIGGIPEEITSLKLLKNLNLSRNYLNGRIPHEIGFMQSLESLDLSSNKFSGEKPPSLSNISFLSYLNLSYNNLSGRIPAGSQLDTLYLEHPDMYSGNNGLCGPPLRINCSSFSCCPCVPVGFRW